MRALRAEGGEADGPGVSLASAVEVGGALGLAVADGLGDALADATHGAGDGDVLVGVCAEQLRAAISSRARAGQDRRIGHTGRISGISLGAAEPD